MLSRKLILLIIIQYIIAISSSGVEMRTDRAEYLQGEEPMLVIRNRGPNTVTFGAYYWLQRHQDGEWVKIPFKENVAFPAWLGELEPGDKYRERIRYGGLAEEPCEGRYRVAKEFTIEKTGSVITKYAEFYIRTKWSYKMIWDRFRLHIGITVCALIVITVLLRRKGFKS